MPTSSEAKSSLQSKTQAGSHQLEKEPWYAAAVQRFSCRPSENPLGRRCEVASGDTFS